MLDLGVANGILQVSNLFCYKELVMARSVLHCPQCERQLYADQEDYQPKGTWVCLRLPQWNLRQR